MQFQSKINGDFVEEFVRQKLNVDLTGGLIDLEINGTLYEIKSCCARCKCGNTTRAGRFWIKAEQHNTLLDKHGYYILIVVNEEGEPVQSRIIPAHELCGYTQKKNFTKNWKSLFCKPSFWGR